MPDDTNRLGQSLMQLHVSIVGEPVAEPTEPPKSEDTIEATPIKSKITLAQSKVLSQLPGRATDSLLNVTRPDGGKIQVRFKSIGSIDQLRPAVFKISRDSQFSSISRFLEKRLKLDKVYCYLANSIVPNPDDRIGNLYDLFRSGHELIVSYCNVVAFG